MSLVKDGWREPPVPCSMISWFAMDVCGGPHGDGAAADVPDFGVGVPVKVTECLPIIVGPTKTS